MWYTAELTRADVDEAYAQPVLHEVSEPGALNTSMLDWWNSVVKGTKVGSLFLSLRAAGSYDVTHTGRQGASKRSRFVGRCP